MQVEDPEFLNASEELIKFYREYPEVAAEDLLLIELSDIQKVVLRAMWFKSYVMSIMCRGSGKCVSGDTYLFTNKGIKQIRDLSREVEILTDADFSVSNGQSIFPAEKVYYDGIKPTNHFLTRKGYSIAATDDHPLLTMSLAGNLEWKKSYDVQEGDFLVLERGTNVWGRKHVDPDYAYLLGLLIGDGCLSRENIVSFTNEDDDLLASFGELSQRFLNYSPKIRAPKNRARHSVIYSKKIRQQLVAEGLELSLAPNKKLPHLLLDAQREAIVAFLQACFDTDGWFFTAKNEVGFCSSSADLAEVVHLLLLNLGIVGKKRFKANRKAGAYLIEIHGKEVLKFAEVVGFRCKRKQNLLQEYLKSFPNFNTNLDVIPHQKKRMRRILENVQKNKGSVSLKIRRQLSHYSQYWSPSYAKVEELLSHLTFETRDTLFLREVLKFHYVFDRVEKKTYRAEKVYDLVMPEGAQHAFVGNGFINHNTFLNAVFACLKAMLYPGYRIGLLAPTFRQAKMMFDECTKLWQRSPILQSATDRKPTQQSDNCYIRFKAVGGRNASVIQAIPLGDGTKIRGSRFYTILCDEFPHIPPDIFNMVIRPMAATVAEPMENVRRLRQQKKLLELGLITQDEIDESQAANQIIITSSGYFQFNHMFKLYCTYREQQRNGNDKYAVFRVPYQLLPEGFLSEDNIKAAKEEMSSLQFRMEYEAAFIPDTDAFYKASLLDSCTTASFSPQVVGMPGKSYVLGIDPARSEDSFAICIAEVGVPARVVHAIELRKQPFPRMAETIEDLCDAFHVTSIYMDAGGGGLAIKDILAENSRSNPKGPILDPEDEVHQYKAGRHVLTMCDFTTEFISTSNFAALRLLEHRDILFPNIPKDFEPTLAQEEGWATIQTMKLQMQSIELTETPTGKHHFDVPKGEGHGKQKKDLYTSFLLAARAVYDMLWSEQLPESILFHGGVLTPRDEKNPITFVGDPELGASIMNIPDALREKLEISLDPDAYRQKMLQGMQHSRKVLTSPVALLKPKPGKKK